MSSRAASRSLLEEEDLATQDTLAMSTEQRIDLLVSLITDKIIQDSEADYTLLNKILETGS